MKICDFLFGIVEFLGIKTVIIPPAVYIPNDNGVTSNKTHALTALLPSPFNMAAWTAAP